MRSSRSAHAILSLPHKYRVPLRRKRSLGYARDDDTRERAISHSLSFLHVEGCPFGADLSSAFGAPLLQGATQQSCKNADPSQGLLPHIVISSAARNLPCTTVKQRASDEEQPKHLGDFIILPHKYRVPPQRKRSLGSARDDDMRERVISHSLSFLHVEGCPCGAVYPPPSARPFFKGLLRWHVKAQHPSATHFPMGKSTK